MHIFHGRLSASQRFHTISSKVSVRLHILIWCLLSSQVSETLTEEDPNSGTMIDCFGGS